MRRAHGHFIVAAILILACACGPGRPRIADPTANVTTLPSPAPLTTAELAILRKASAERGTLYWRVRHPDGPRCEAWTFEPDPDDESRGHLVHSDGDLRLRFTHELSDGRLRLHSPERERVKLATPGALSTTIAALPCVFSGMSLRPAADPAPRQVVLTSDERWFLGAEACAAAGPDLDPQPPAPGEIHPLGCASALADPGTRTREDPPAPPDPPALRLAASRRVFWLRHRGGRTVCEAWHHEAASPQRGSLRRDDAGSRTVYGYAAGLGVLTLIGPNVARRVRGPDGPAELVRARGCLLTSAFTLADKVLSFGEDRWYLRRRDCERAR
ncbi:MAG TPA: hypothetical protein VGB85_19435, partial [Nannocystis sp.]